MNINTQSLNEQDDLNWVRNAFFVPERAGSIGKNTNRVAMTYSQQFSASSLTFADTSLGGNRSINPKPQFTKFADPNLPSLITKENTTGNPSNVESLGMGRYYAEAIDTNASRIYMQFGVPAYNSITNFLTSFYDPMHGNMANTGTVGGGLLHTFGKYLGLITIWSVIPELCIMNYLYTTSRKIVADLQRRPLSRFCYLKPAMPLYWSMVTVIVNALAVNMKLTQGTSSGDVKRGDFKQGQYAITYGQSENDMMELSKILPDIMRNGNGGIDIRNVANRYQRLADAHDRAMHAIQEKATTDTEAEDLILAYLKGENKNLVLTPTTIAEYMKGYAEGVAGQGKYLLDTLTDALPNAVPADAKPAEQAVDKVVDNAMQAVKDSSPNTFNAVNKLWTGLAEHFQSYSEYATAELRDGSAFVSFIVDWESHVRESFSNRTKESDIAAKMNETSRSSRSRLYNIANGNLGDNIIADTIEAAISGIGSIASGLAEAVHMSGFAMLGGRALVDIPEMWDSSSTNLPSSTYTIQLRTPYGNPISILNNILIPAAMLLAAVSPRSTGRNSYTGPFLLKLYQKGKVQTQYSIITDLSFTRGTGNVGWSVNQQPLGIDVTFTIQNLSKLLHIPITGELSIADVLTNGYITMFDEDTNFTDYMAVLGSLGLAEQYYATSRWRLRRAKAQQNVSTFLSVDNLLQWGITDSLPGNILTLIARKGRLDQAG